MTQLYPEPIDKLVAHLCYLVCHYSLIHDLLTGEGSLGDLTNQPDGLRDAIRGHDDGFPDYHHWVWFFNEARLTLDEWHTVMDYALSSLTVCGRYTDSSSDPAIDRWSAKCRRQLQELRHLVPYPETLIPNGGLPSQEDLDRAEKLIAVVNDRIRELQGIGPEAEGISPTSTLSDWKPPPGTIGAKTVNANGVPRSTLAYWISKDNPNVSADPMTGEQYVPTDWLDGRVARWKKKNTPTMPRRPKKL